MQNLRDKLLKAGLVSEEQTKKAETEATARPARPPREPQRREPPRRESPPRAAPRREAPGREGSQGGFAARRAEMAIPKLPPLPGSKEHQRQLAAQQREIDRKLGELVFPNQVALEPGTHTFFFVTRKGKLRRLEISEAQAKLLEEGKLAVVERQEPAQIEHSLVLPEIAQKMYEVYPKAVRFLNRAEAPVGFLSEDELKQRQEAEARGETVEEPGEAPASAEPQAPTSEAVAPKAIGADAPRAEASGSDTWIAIKRAPRAG